jgi:hypothetical protein
MDSIGVQNSDLAEFTLSTQSEILRFAHDDSEGLGMTAVFTQTPKPRPSCSSLPHSLRRLDVVALASWAYNLLWRFGCRAVLSKCI